MNRLSSFLVLAGSVMVVLALVFGYFVSIFGIPANGAVLASSVPEVATASFAPSIPPILFAPISLLLGLFCWWLGIRMRGSR